VADAWERESKDQEQRQEQEQGYIHPIDRMLGGLWGAIVGDALGVPVEFSWRKDLKRDPVTDMRGYGTYNLPPGSWSDDSSMLLCTVEALCEPGYDAQRLAELYLEWYQDARWTPHGVVFDIGSTTRRAMQRVLEGVEPEKAGDAGAWDNGNGSLMRILPVALRWGWGAAPVDEMLAMAHRVSSVTHRHPRSLMACGLYCLMARGLLRGMAPAEAYRYMIEEGERYYGRGPFQREVVHFARVLSGEIAAAAEETIESSGYVLHTMEASLWALLTTGSFEEAVLKAVNLGRDTDTTASVTGGLAGLAYGREAIPERWIDALARRDEIEALLESFVTFVLKNVK